MVTIRVLEVVKGRLEVPIEVADGEQKLVCTKVCMKVDGDIGELTLGYKIITDITTAIRLSK